MTIAIIGGGFSGAALSAHLLRKGKRGTRIDLVEPRSRLGGGIAHGDASPHHILNVTADRMSLWSNQPFAFLDWARRNGPRLGWPEARSARDQTYLPRRLYGDYVEAELSNTIALGLATFKHHQTTAEALSLSDGAFVVSLKTGERIRADRVVLANGFRPPSIPFPVFGEGPRFIVDPWQSASLEEVGLDDTVLLVGTGLTMVDMVYSLDRRGHRGLVTALSRHGYLPRIHDSADKSLPIINIQDASKGVVYTLRKFRSALEEGIYDWRTAVDAMRPIIDELWQALPSSEQDRFLRHLRPLWEVHRHRMPAQSADLLLKRFGQSRLEVVAARILEMKIHDVHVSTEIRHRHKPTSVTRHFDWVVNCTPPAPPLAPEFDQLTRSLLEAGLAREHRSGLGFDVDKYGRALNPGGEPIPNLFVLGPPRRGHAIEATAVPHIRPQLESLTKALLHDKGNLQ